MVHDKTNKVRVCVWCTYEARRGDWGLVVERWLSLRLTLERDGLALSSSAIFPSSACIGSLPKYSANVYVDKEEWRRRSNILWWMLVYLKGCGVTSSHCMTLKRFLFRLQLDYVGGWVDSMRVESVCMCGINVPHLMPFSLQWSPASVSLTSHLEIHTDTLIFRNT